RNIETFAHFSRSKKRLQRLGSSVVRSVSHTTVPDVTSGFRAYNREAALQVQVVSRFTYTIETIIQAGKMLVSVDHVPVGTNPQVRASRLFSSTWSYVRRNAVAIFRIYTMYEPLRVFLVAAAVAAAVWLGTAATGLTPHPYFSAASHALSAEEYGGITLLWAAVFITVNVLYRPVEELLSRTIAHRHARGREGTEHLRVAAAIQLG